MSVVSASGIYSSNLIIFHYSDATVQPVHYAEIGRSCHRGALGVCRHCQKGCSFKGFNNVPGSGFLPQVWYLLTAVLKSQ